MRKSIGEKRKPCKNCEGKGTLKKGDKIVKCQRCGGTGIKPLMPRRTDHLPTVLAREECLARCPSRRLSSIIRSIALRS